MSISSDASVLLVGNPFADYAALNEVGSVETFFQNALSTSISYSSAGPPIFGADARVRMGHVVLTSADGSVAIIISEPFGTSKFITSYQRQDEGSNPVWTKIHVPQTDDSNNEGRILGSQASISADGSVLIVAGDSNIADVTVYRRNNHNKTSNQWDDISVIVPGPTSGTSASVSISSDGSKIAYYGGTNRELVRTHVWVENEIDSSGGSWMEVGSIQRMPHSPPYTSVRDLVLSGNGEVLAIAQSRIVYTYRYNAISKTWTKYGSIPYFEDGGSSIDVCALALNFDGSILAIGNYDNDNNFPDGKMNLGAVETYSYREDDNTWNVFGNKIRGVGNWDSVGKGVAFSSNGRYLGVESSAGVFLYELVES